MVSESDLSVSQTSAYASVHHEMPARVGIESLSFKEADSELEKTEAIIAEAGALAQEFFSAKVALEQILSDSFPFKADAVVPFGNGAFFYRCSGFRQFMFALD